MAMPIHIHIHILILIHIHLNRGAHVLELDRAVQDITETAVSNVYPSLLVARVTGSRKRRVPSPALPLVSAPA
jgi:hypothetical protein